jgi:predicted SprT family Zn-dependent metalloprotease
LKSFRELGISVVLVAIILCAVHYAVAQEQLRDLNLDTIYQDINRDSFGGELPDIPVEWADLTDKYGVTAYDGTFEIRIDRVMNTSRADVVETLRHEACHVATVEHLNGEDPHGPVFERCMMRFDASPEIQETNTR